MTKLIGEIASFVIIAVLMAVVIVLALSRDENFYPSDGGVPACIQTQLEEVERYREINEEDYYIFKAWCTDQRNQ